MDLQKAVLGIELGSTRIKGVLIDENHQPIATGSYAWENDLVDGVWTYELSDAVKGVQACFAELKADAEAKFGKPLTTVAGIGISGMMHGYLVFDKEGNQIAPFRTWRNTITGPAAAELTELFKFNIPQRWSIAHLYQAILNKEDHVKDIATLTKHLPVLRIHAIRHSLLLFLPHKLRKRCTCRQLFVPPLSNR